MRFKLLLITLAVAISSAVTYGQTDSKAQWKAFEPDVEEFSVQVPTDLRSSAVLDLKAPRRYQGVTNGVYLYAFSDAINRPSEFPVIKRFVQESTKAQFENPMSEFTKASVEFADAFGFYNRIVVFRSSTRIYVFQSVSEDKENEIAAKFISSVATQQKALDTALPNPAETKDDLSMPVASPAGDGSGGGIGNGNSSGTGSGSGSGIGIGSGSGGLNAGVSLPPQPHSTTPLRLLSKPRPGYTNLARFYNIQGTVPVRVTFLANGTIGSVVPLKRLPFGLVDSAVNAAKSITFEPAITDGTAVTTAKMVEYTFSIY